MQRKPTFNRADTNDCNPALYEPKWPTLFDSIVNVMPATPHRCFTAPPSETTLWRYMDFTKFVSMLESKTLFFTRSDLFEDPFEGTYPRGNIEDRKRYTSPLPDAPYWQTQKSFEDERKSARRCTYISCWHANELESAGMWRLYAQTKEAVAIRTTVSKLCLALPGEAMVGQVEYVDFETAIIPADNGFWPFLHKRRSFEHEKEVRAIVMRYGSRTSAIDDPNAPPGIGVNTDLPSLVQSVYVAPASAPWFADLVKKVLRTYELEVPVRQSSLDAMPMF